MIEQAYQLGERMGIAVWCEDEAGPYGTVPYAGASWQLEGQPAEYPHAYFREGTAKMLTLFHPQSGQVRVKGVTNTRNDTLHGWLKDELTAILATLPEPSPVADAPANRAAWESWRENVTVKATLSGDLPPLRLLLVMDNLTGHKNPNWLIWCFQQGILPIFTPLGGSWLNMAESIQRILKRRALDGFHPQDVQTIIDRLEAVARGWNAHPTPFVWNRNRRIRRQRVRDKQLHPVGGSGAASPRPIVRLNHWRRSQQLTHYVTASGNLTLDDLTLSGGATRQIDPNVAESDGGAIYVLGTTNLTGVTLANNSAFDDGGAVYASGTLDVTDSTFTANTASDDGGAIAAPEGTVSLSLSTFANNAATIDGGALDLDGAAITTLSDSTLHDNHAGSNGGAINAGGTASLTVTGSTFTSNSSVADGGAIYTTVSVSVQQSQFTTNHTDADGGALSSLSGTLTVTGSTFDGNTAVGNGGAIEIDPAATLNVSTSTFINSTAGGDGGAVQSYGGPVVKSRPDLSQSCAPTLSHSKSPELSHT